MTPRKFWVWHLVLAGIWVEIITLGVHGGFPSWYSMLTLGYGRVISQFLTPSYWAPIGHRESPMLGHSNLFEKARLKWMSGVQVALFTGHHLCELNDLGWSGWGVWSFRLPMEEWGELLSCVPMSTGEIWPSRPSSPARLLRSISTILSPEA